MSLKTYTIKFATLGADLDNFQLTSNGGPVTPPMANRTQLLGGLTVSTSATATTLTVESTGLCTNAVVLNLPTSNPPTGGTGTPPCAGIATAIEVTQSAETESGVTTDCLNDSGGVISSGNAVMERTITFKLIDCDGVPVVASTNIPISVRLDSVYCGGPGTSYATVTIFAGQSQATMTYDTQMVDNGGDYARCGCYTTITAFGSATSINYPVNVV